MMSARFFVFVVVPMLGCLCYLLCPQGGRQERGLLYLAIGALGLGAFFLLLEFAGIGFFP